MSPEPLDVSTELVESPPSPPAANPLLSSLLGAGGGLDLQGLLAAQMGGLGGSGDLMSLLAAQAGGGTDDSLALAMRWLEMRNAAEALTEEEDEPSEAELELQRLEERQLRRDRQAARRERAQELESLMNSMYAELESLRVRNDVLAAALGACYLCFGEDPMCPECAGQGAPGSLAPEPDPFRQFVVPSVRRVRAAQARSLDRAPPNGRKEWSSNGNRYRPEVNGQPQTDTTE